MASSINKKLLKALKSDQWQDSNTDGVVSFDEFDSQFQTTLRRTLDNKANKKRNTAKNKSGEVTFTRTISGENNNTETMEIVKKDGFIVVIEIVTGDDHIDYTKKVNGNIVYQIEKTICNNEDHGQGIELTLFNYNLAGTQTVQYVEYYPSDKVLNKTKEQIIVSTPTPVNGGDTNPVEGDGVTPVDGGDTNPVEGDGATPVNGGYTNPVEGDGVTPVDGGDTNPVEGDGATPVNGGDTNPVEGDGVTPVDGGDTNPVEGDGVTPVDGGDTNPVEGDGVTPVDGGDTNPVEGDGATPVDGGDTNPVEGDDAPPVDDGKEGKSKSEKLKKGLKVGAAVGGTLLLTALATVLAIYIINTKSQDMGNPQNAPEDGGSSWSQTEGISSLVSDSFLQSFTTSAKMNTTNNKTYENQPFSGMTNREYHNFINNPTKGQTR